MTNVHKEYDKPFLVEPSKLGRLVDKIHERLGDHKDARLHDAFEVFLAGNRRDEVTTLDEVLALDNSSKYRITRLVATCSASSPGAARPEHEVQVDFGRPRPKGSGGGTTTGVAVSVRSDAVGWAARTLSEVEEQVERNWLHHVQPFFVLVGLLIAGMLLLASSFLYLRTPLSSDWWLSTTDLERIETILAQRPALTEEDLREISTMQMKNIVADNRALRQARGKRTVFIVVPIFVVVICVVVLLATCYPRAVFLWGDEVDRYASTLQRRKAMWGVIVSVTVLAVSSRFVGESVMSWFTR